VNNKTEIMQHILKVEVNFIFRKYIKSASGIFFCVCSHMWTQVF